MNSFIEITIKSMQITLAVMLFIFIFEQYRLRHVGNGVVRKLRNYTAWQTSSLVVAFVVAIFYSRDGFSGTIVGELIALGATLFMFITFTMGTKLFWDIRRGKYDKYF